MRALFLLVALSALSAAQSAPTEKIYEAGKEGVAYPKPISTPEPDFPAQARNKERFHRVVALDGYVGKDGRYHDATVVSSAGAEFDKEALRTIKS